MATTNTDRHLALTLAHEQEAHKTKLTGMPPYPDDVIQRAKEYEAYLDGSAERKAKQNKDLTQAAHVAHEANRILQIIQNEDFVSLPWEETEKNIRNSAIDGVEAVLKNPFITPNELHQNWVKFKIADGWVYGEKRDDELKHHPCLIPYEALPENQRNKDAMFQAVVRAVFGI